MTPREALLAAARVCRYRAEVHQITGFSAGELEALRCERAILALAEQQTNDLRGAAALGNVPQADHGLVVGTPFDSASRPCTEAQSAPHPDPAGQVSAQAEFGRSAEANLCKQRDAAGNAAPALPGPETVPVPREPTEAMIDAPRQIILYAETPGRTLEGLRAHLERSGVDYLAWFPVWATRECGHLTKAAIATLVYRAMLAAGSAK